MKTIGMITDTCALIALMRRNRSGRTYRTCLTRRLREIKRNTPSSHAAFAEAQLGSI
jgi:hypothetical protein